MTWSCWSYQVDNDGRKSWVNRFNEQRTNNIWMCGIIDKTKGISDNGQVCVLVDLRNDKYLSQMDDNEYITQIKEYRNSYPCARIKNIIGLDSNIENKPSNVLSNDDSKLYFIEWWIHIYNN